MNNEQNPFDVMVDLGQDKIKLLIATLSDNHEKVDDVTFQVIDTVNVLLDQQADMLDEQWRRGSK
ncbi:MULTISPECIES: hypothetical protein [Streptococcus]|uniref:Uncharacterized protein n=1 Tax=Streptococcus pseudopneumoniae TaxID=257758 RepID=A0A1S9ZNQ3_9STRE|nr:MULTISPECIES: hypothetical protein [Streptococcus]ETE01935.1 hypothetical protein U750_11530 [Streptococcus pseudopneumoniae G42]QBX18591.1 hypothetical protein Javan433_0057 [Streptococcus phage Javan433]QBX18618.1 hypothetical protein Javan439_0014 [Streptococcus phage Javan439]QBX28106.1 hypothetical protein Javan440_0014 [Streptococcus phage Javan440]EID69731.1 hypothetical protein HMPREF1112_1414 [Streptococcus pseudopneumoniae SK674]